MADDSRFRSLDSNLCERDVGKLFVFVSEIALLQATMLRRAFQPLTEVAPIADGCHRTFFEMWAGRGNLGACGDHPGADLLDRGKSDFRSGLHDDQDLLRRSPCALH